MLLLGLLVGGLEQRKRLHKHESTTRDHLLNSTVRTVLSITVTCGVQYQSQKKKLYSVFELRRLPSNRRQMEWKDRDALDRKSVV